MKKLEESLIISYQMGKVASSAITSSVPNCIQVHSWDGEEPIKYFSSRYTGSLRGRILQSLKWRYTSLKLNKKIAKAKKQRKPIKFIVGVREPISRNISGYFQTLTAREDGKTLQEQMNNYFAFCSHLSSSYWFETEINRYLEIDIFNYSFDKEKGFTVLNVAGVELFIYQFEKLGSLESEIGNFLDIDNFKLKRSNSADDKWLKDLYIDFKNDIEFPKYYIEMMYSTKYCEHFYSPTDIAHYKAKWVK